jgi:hypothetical protein
VSQPANCPDLPALEQLALGLLAAEDLESWAPHVEVCRRCAERLETLSLQDALLDTIRSAKQSPALVGDEEIERLLGQLQDLLPATSEPQDTGAFQSPGQQTPVEPSRAISRLAAPGSNHPHAAPQPGPLGKTRAFTPGAEVEANFSTSQHPSWAAMVLRCLGD